MKGSNRVQGRGGRGGRTARCHLVLGAADERCVVPERATRLGTNRNSYLIAYNHVHRDAEVPGENLNQNVTHCQRQGSSSLGTPVLT